MGILTTKDAADKLGLSVQRIHAFIKDGRLPAQRLGRDYVINEHDLALVADRKTGRPKKVEGEEETKHITYTEPPENFGPLTHKERLQAEIQAHQDALAFKPSVAAVRKVGNAVKTPAKSKTKTKATEAEATEATRKSAPVKAKSATKKRASKKGN